MDVVNILSMLYSSLTATGQKPAKSHFPFFFHDRLNCTLLRRFPLYNDGNPPIGLMNVGFVQDAYPRTRSSSNRGHAESPHLPDDYSLPVAFNDLTVIGRNNNINPAT